MVNCERHCVAWVEGNELRPRLHARALFREDEFTASEIALWFGEQNRYLNGKHIDSTVGAAARFQRSYSGRQPGDPAKAGRIGSHV